MDEEIVCAFEDVGLVLRKWRKEKNMTIEGVAKDAVCARATVSAIECGRKHKTISARLEILKDLFELFGYDIKFIITKKQEKKAERGQSDDIWRY
jgi:transcriptional regulator with XRE-family HTH domain